MNKLTKTFLGEAGGGLGPGVLSRKSAPASDLGTIVWSDSADGRVVTHDKSQKDHRFLALPA